MRSFSFFFLLSSIIFSLPATAEDSARPNVIWILLDACRAESLGSYGYERDTSPTLDRLASEGVRFSNHFSQASKTYQSVPSYMTGLYFPQTCFSKRYSQTIFERTPPPNEKLLGEILGEAGYTTALFCTMPLFLKEDRLSKSFDEAHIWPQGEHILLQRWVVMTEKLNAWLGDRPSDEPFFLYIHAADTHFPHEMVPPYDQWMDPDYDLSQLQPGGYGQNYWRHDHAPFTEEDREWLRGYYDGMIRDVDDRVGELIAKLEELNLLENTLILITADHGQLIGEDGHTVAHRGDTDQNVHIPLILRGPGIPTGTVVDALTEHVDIVPSLVEFLGITTDAAFDGRSFLPLFTGEEPDDWRDYVFMIPDRSTYEEPTGFSLRGRTLKYLFDNKGTLTHVMKSPDREEKRIDLTLTHNQNSMLLEKHLAEHFLPKLQLMQQAPVERIVLEGAWLANYGKPKDAVEDYYISGAKAREELEIDNKWAYTDGFLWAMHAKEQVPPLSYSGKAPNGVYKVQAHLWNSLDFQGYPASSLHLRFNKEESQEVYGISLPEKDSRLFSLPLGSLSIDEEVLDITLLPSSLPSWTRLFSIELVPEDKMAEDADTEEAPTLSPEEADELNEMIKSAGYL